jgi:hypothetical protein
VVIRARWNAQLLEQCLALNIYLEIIDDYPEFLIRILSLL